MRGAAAQRPRGRRLLLLDKAAEKLFFRQLAADGEGRRSDGRGFARFPTEDKKVDVYVRMPLLFNPVARFIPLGAEPRPEVVSGMAKIAAERCAATHHWREPFAIYEATRR